MVRVCVWVCLCVGGVGGLRSPTRYTNAVAGPCPNHHESRQKTGMQCPGLLPQHKAGARIGSTVGADARVQDRHPGGRPGGGKQGRRARSPCRSGMPRSHGCPATAAEILAASCTICRACRDGSAAQRIGGAGHHKGRRCLCARVRLQANSRPWGQPGKSPKRKNGRALARVPKERMGVPWQVTQERDAPR